MTQGLYLSLDERLGSGHRLDAHSGLKPDIAQSPKSAKLRHWMWRRLKEKAA